MSNLIPRPYFNSRRQRWECQGCRGRHIIDPEMIEHSSTCGWMAQELEQSQIHEELGKHNKPIRFRSANPRSYYKVVEESPCYGVSRGADDKFTVSRHKSHGLDHRALVRLADPYHAVRVMEWFRENDLIVRFVIEAFDSGDADKYRTLIHRAMEATKNDSENMDPQDQGSAHSSEAARGVESHEDREGHAVD